VTSVKGENSPGEMMVEGSEKNSWRSIDECLEVLVARNFSASSNLNDRIPEFLLRKP